VDRVIAEGDYVVVHLRTLWGRSRPSTSAIDIFKLRDGLIQEHWDVVQELPRNAIVCPAQRPGMTSMEGCAE
jgi:predicted SnoaL-like aldol condensation-catalyzing enzyme